MTRWVVRAACVLAMGAGVVRGEGAVPDLKGALAAQRDVWGELAMNRPEGATYDFFEGLLPPLRYVKAGEFRCYPVVLGVPQGEHKGRWISDGSGVNLKGWLKEYPGWWKEFPVGARFEVGGEGFGQDLSKVRGPTLERGWVPIVKVSYEKGGAVVEQEAMAAHLEAGRDRGVVLVRFEVKEGQTELGVRLESASTLVVGDGVVTDGEGRVVVWFGEGWTYDAAGKRLVAQVVKGKSLLVGVVSDPVKGVELGKLDEEEYRRQREACVKEWEGRIGECMGVEVPEERVNRAWRTMVADDLIMAGGDRMYYSAGNVYEFLYVAENGDAVRSLLVFGLLDRAKRMVDPLLNIEEKGLQSGLGYHNAGFKLQLVAHTYWETRDAEFVRQRRAKLRAIEDKIIGGIEKGSGLLPKERYCADIEMPVYSLNSNANCWRGLRDMAAVWREIGETGEAERIEAVAGKFRQAIVAAVAKSERRDVTPAFVPVALFGAEKPYDVLTSSRLGSYWDLMIPYVLGSGILSREQESAVLEYLKTHGGLCMGLIRFHQHSGLVANDDAVDDLYGLRYVQTLMRRDDDVERTVVSFYGKLAQGVTRDTFIGGEGTGLVPWDANGRPIFLPPNSSSNGFFLTMLREMLVQDVGLEAEGRPTELRLLFGTPRGWMEEGKVIRVERAPTAFGAVSVVARSELSKGRVVVEVTPPGERVAGKMRLRARVPAGWVVTGAEVGGEKLSVDKDGTVDVTGRREAFAVTFRVERRA